MTSLEKRFKTPIEGLVLGNLLIIHAWEMPKGSLVPSPTLQKEIEERIKQNGMAGHKLAALLNRSESVVRRMLGKRDGGVRVGNFFAVTDFLGIDRYSAEKEIIMWEDQCRGWRPFTGKFPFELTPLVFRIASHLVGDGKPVRGGFFQKNEHIHYMVDLIEQTLNIRVNFYEDYKGVCELSVPNFLVQCISARLGILQSEIKSKTFFEKIRELPKEYQIQAVAAFFVDEGSVIGRIRFAQKDPAILEGLISILDSLGYSHTEIKLAKTRLKGKEFCYCYLDLYADGAKAFFEDVNELVKRYGSMAGLWQKHQIVDRYLQNVDVTLSLKRREARWIQKILLEKFDGRIFSIGGLSREFKISYSRAYDILRNLREKGKAERVKRGLYQISSGGTQ